MSSNVYEWCHDWYGNYSSLSQTNPTYPSLDFLCVFRGGSWDSIAGLCRVSNRLNYAPDGFDSDLGLRADK